LHLHFASGGLTLAGLATIAPIPRSSARHSSARRILVVAGFAHALHDGYAMLEENSPVVSRLDRAIWAGHRGASLTQQLLAFARKQPLAPMPINLSALLSDMADMLQRTLGEHIDIEVKHAAGLWTAMADPAQVESALLNLALNARDAMPGGGRLTIEVANKVLDPDYARRHAEVVPGDYVMLAVSDTGTGMSRDVLARVFEPFFTTKEPGKGTGLGLVMVFGFAKQSGGHMNIHSEPGEGTTVRLYLPRAIGIELPGTQRITAPVELPRGSATILVVEDDDDVREVAVVILRDLGYRVLTAANGAEALVIFGENGAKVDLLLVDVVLPGGMKGDEVARRLGEVCPGVRVLFMTGYTENADVDPDRRDDGVQRISKPFQRAQLARKVGRCSAPCAPWRRAVRRASAPWIASSPRLLSSSPRKRGPRRQLGPRFREDECVREGALSARWKPVREPVVGAPDRGVGPVHCLCW
jgi:CheY-like chemotaxis protein